jgi:hypothetical protein
LLRADQGDEVAAAAVIQEEDEVVPKGPAKG